jgi:hypothetical protein
MKTTKIILSLILTGLLTWVGIGIVVYLLSEMNFKESMSSSQTILTFILGGWLPISGVFIDLTE